MISVIFKTLWLFGKKRKAVSGIIIAFATIFAYQIHNNTQLQQPLDLYHDISSQVSEIDREMFKVSGIASRFRDDAQYPSSSIIEFNKPINGRTYSRCDHHGF